MAEAAESVKALCFASTAERRSRGLDRTLLASADAANHEAGALNQRNLVVKQCFRSYEEKSYLRNSLMPVRPQPLCKSLCHETSAAQEKCGAAPSDCSPYQERTGENEIPHIATQ